MLRRKNSDFDEKIEDNKKIKISKKVNIFKVDKIIKILFNFFLFYLNDNMWRLLIIIYKLLMALHLKIKKNLIVKFLDLYFIWIK